MERILMQALESILRKLVESFSSKVVEQTTDTALSRAKKIKDFELILKALQKNLKALNAKACDVEEEIKNAELSGRKKRKREVEEWLEEVRSIERDVVELGSQVESEGFIMRLMDGGTTAQLHDEVDKLIEQSRNFGELVLDVCGTAAQLHEGNAGDICQLQKQVNELQGQLANKAQAEIVNTLEKQVKELQVQLTKAQAEIVNMHQKHVNELQEQLAKAQAEIVNMQRQQSNLVALICMEMKQSTNTMLPHGQQSFFDDFSGSPHSKMEQNNFLDFLCQPIVASADMFLY